jgi:hypothetical protein
MPQKGGDFARGLSNRALNCAERANIKLNDSDAEVRKAVDFPEHFVAGNHGPNVLRSPGENDVPRFQLVRARELRNLLGHAPYHVGNVRVLFHGAVDREGNATFGLMPHFFGEVEGPMGADWSKLLPISHGFCCTFIVS